MRDHPDGRDLTEKFAYLHRDDEIQMNRLIYAIQRAFNGDKEASQPTNNEPVIDTTDPKFAEQFQGFTGMPGRTQ